MEGGAEGGTACAFAGVPSARPLVRAGMLRAVAVTSEALWHSVPEVPTMAEAGIPDMVMQTWIGLLAPARTPRPIVDALNRQVLAILQRDDIKRQLQDVGMEVAPTTPEQFQHTIAQEINLHAQLVKAAGLVPQ